MGKYVWQWESRRSQLSQPMTSYVPLACTELLWRNRARILQRHLNLGVCTMKMRPWRRAQLIARSSEQVQAEEAAAASWSHVVTLAYGTTLRARAYLWLPQSTGTGAGAQAAAEPIAGPFGAQRALAQLWLPACPVPWGPSRESRQGVGKRKCYHPLFTKRGTETENKWVGFPR